MKNIFKVTKFIGEVAQISGEPLVTGAGFLIEKGSDIALSHISQREKNRLEHSTRSIATKIGQRLKAEKTPNDLSMVNYQEPIINELLIHTLTKCRDEPEEKKNHFTENVFVSVLFNEGRFTTDYQWGHSAIKDIERFTYHQILLFNLVCSRAELIHSVNEIIYKKYISIFKTPFGVEHDRFNFYQSDQQLILNDFHTLYDMQYLKEGDCIAKLHIQNGNVSNDQYPFFCGIIPSPIKGLRIQELFFPDLNIPAHLEQDISSKETNIPDYLERDTSKLDSIIFKKERLENYIEEYH